MYAYIMIHGFVCVCIFCKRVLCIMLDMQTCQSPFPMPRVFVRVRCAVANMSSISTPHSFTFMPGIRLGTQKKTKEYRLTNNCAGALMSIFNYLTQRN